MFLSLLLMLSAFNLELTLSEKSIELLGRSMGWPDAVAGSVLSSSDEGFRFHSTRDAALTMNVFIRMQENKPDPKMDEHIWNWIRLEQIHQHFRTPSGKMSFTEDVQKIYGPEAMSIEWDLAEPKFLPNLFPYEGPCVRPQFEGPALRALAMIRYANYLHRNGRIDEAKKLFNPDASLRSPIRTDLNFIASTWNTTGANLWGHKSKFPFYQRLVQYRALVEGVKLAFLLNDINSGSRFMKEAEALRHRIEEQWNEQKDASVDSSIVLASLHSRGSDEKADFFAPSDPRILKVASELETKFQKLYPLNQTIPEDQETAIGNELNADSHPTYLSTAAFAELYFLSGQPQKAQKFLNTISQHTSAEEYWTESFDATTGKPVGAHEFILSASAYLNALIAKNHPDAR